MEDSITNITKSNSVNARTQLLNDALRLISRYARYDSVGMYSLLKEKNVSDSEIARRLKTSRQSVHLKYAIGYQSENKNGN